ncbi:MAG: hypothetical protein GC151_15815 [Betaproteobacteria bacterium]|nr:hypothetical protein [Betaproteobacteria bacterium]
MNDTSDIHSRVAALERLAQGGDAKAMFDLGCLHDIPEKPGLTIDLDAARAWYSRAADAGHPWAQFALGNMLERAQGGPRNDHAARRWYERAADRGIAEAQMHLARMLQAGLGGPAEPAEATRWYERAAAQGHEVAARDLALMHLEKSAPDPNVQKARELLEFAADKLDGLAHLVLGDLYMRGAWGERHGGMALVHYCTAALLLHEGDAFRRAVTARDALLARRPDLREAYESQAREFIRARRPEGDGNARASVSRHGTDDPTKTE